MDLVGADLVAALLVQDRGDPSDEHEVGPVLAAELLDRLVGGVLPLVHALVADLFPLLGGGHHVHPSRVHERPLDVADEGGDGDVLRRLVANGAHDHGGAFVVSFHVLRVPDAGQGVPDHLLGHEARVGVVPVSGEVDGGVGIDPGHGLPPATEGEQGQTNGEDDGDSEWAHGLPSCYGGPLRIGSISGIRWPG
jgi:hypothetical protein